jgi:alpha-glucosidase (family GH31 glycosyl hydrolase)
MLRPVRTLVAVAALLLVAPAATAAAPVRDGAARFEVVTPSLVRVEIAPDGRFEDGRTQTTAGRMRTSPRFKSSVRGGFLTIRTSAMTLRWRRGSASVDGNSLRVKVGRQTLRPKPGPNPAPLGGWRRSLDLVNGPVPLHEGMLSRAGWYLLDDSATALMTPEGGFAPRSAAAGYQDLYLFAYGRDYARGLRDLRALTGAAPLLPRKAFGVWFSRWWPYSEGDWQALLDRFRAEKVPLDTISLDTDFKQVRDPVASGFAATAVGAPGLPYSWNGWDWNRDLYPDPGRFLRWAHDNGLAAGLNVHPSINDHDPRFPETQERAGGRLAASESCRVAQADTQGQCMVFDWADKPSLDAYMNLHTPFEQDGADFWWLDWCCDASKADAPGLTPDTWINKQYSDRQRARGSRWPAFSRIGGSYQAGFGEAVGTGAFAEHRYSIQFTGDTCGSWPLLGFAAQYTAAAGSIGLPYVSHDVGTFHAVSPSGTCDKDLSPLLTPRENTLPPDMYARWVQLGAFQPLDRLHSHHGQRLPWEYEGKPGQVAADFLRLRESLVPYTYTLAREARDTGLPMVRALYLGWPGRSEAYEHPSEFTLGRRVLVAPVTEPGDPAPVDVWFPPGTWVDWFTGERHRGPAVKKLSVPLERAPVFVRSGAVIATQPPVPTTPAGSPSQLVLTAYRGTGAGRVYDDTGLGLTYRGAWTSFTQRVRRGATTLVIGAARGRFDGQAAARGYELRLVGFARPRRVTVAGRGRRFAYDRATRTVVFETGRLPISRAAKVVVR